MIVRLALLLAGAAFPGDDRLEAMRAKEAELRAAIDAAKSEFTRSLDGPCLCGAATHGDCKTQEVCEPKEEAQRAEIKKRGLDAARELGRVAAWIKLYERVGVEIRGREEQALHLAGVRDRLARIIRKNAENQAWRDDLDDWVKESRKAQSEAFQASLGLIAGPVGAVAREIGESKAAQKRMSQALERTRGLLEKAGDALAAARKSGTTGAAINEWSRLNQIEMALRGLLAQEQTVQQQWERLQTVYDGLGWAFKFVDTTHDVLDARQREGLRGALAALLQALKDIALETAADKALDKLGTESAAAANLHLLRFALDYGIAAWRFYQAHAFVASIVDRVGKDLEILDELRARHEAAQKELNDVRSEIRRLDDSRAKDVLDMSLAIRDGNRDADERIRKYHAPRTK